MFRKFNCWTIMPRRRRVVFIIESTDWIWASWDSQVPWARRGDNTWSGSPTDWWVGRGTWLDNTPPECGVHTTMQAMPHLILNPPFSRDASFFFGGANRECRHKIGFRLLDILLLPPPCSQTFPENCSTWTYDTNLWTRTEGCTHGHWVTIRLL